MDRWIDVFFLVFLRVDRGRGEGKPSAGNRELMDSRWVGQPNSLNPSLREKKPRSADHDAGNFTRWVGVGSGSGAELRKTHASRAVNSEFRLGIRGERVVAS